MRAVSFFKKYIQYIMSSFYKRDNSIWVFGEWFGERVGDNSFYLANYVAKNYDGITVYWLCKDTCDTRRLDPSIRVIDYSSKEAVKISKKSAVAVMNEGIKDLNSDITNYWANAIKVNLWHGVPWKKIGYDSQTVHKQSLIDVFRNKIYQYDYYVSPSQEYSTRIMTAFNAKSDSFIFTGYPRNSLFFKRDLLDMCRSEVEKRVGFKVDKIIVYLPTFRDSQTPMFSFASISNTEFYKWLEDNNVVIIQKAHFADRKSTNVENARIVNIDDISAQELMAASDMLVTDYSSCFFDYLILDKPIIHYLYDYEYYKNKDRGLYYEKEEVACGACPEDEESLVEEIIKNIDNPAIYQEIRKKRRERFLTYEGEDSCKCIVESIQRRLNGSGESV